MQKKLSTEPVGNITGDASHISLSVWVSFAEIYNDCVYDLLTSKKSQREKLNLRCINGSTNIKKLTFISVTSGLEAYKILQYGLQYLKFASTTINNHSSRSHAIFTIKLAQSSNKKKGVSVSSFNFYDLAGSERIKNTHNEGERLKESNNINTSLMVLGRCLHLIRESQKRNGSNKNIPFRASKLTQLLQNGLSGHENMCMIVNINPKKEMFDETQHILNFSTIAKDVIITKKQLNKRSNNSFLKNLPIHENGSIINNCNSNINTEDLLSEISEIENAIEQQKLDFEEDSRNITNKYDNVIEYINKYYENECQIIKNQIDEILENEKPILNEDYMNFMQNQINEGEEKIVAQKEELEQLSLEFINVEKTRNDARNDYIMLEMEQKYEIQKLQEQMEEINNKITFLTMNSINIEHNN